MPVASACPEDPPKTKEKTQGPWPAEGTEAPGRDRGGWCVLFQLYAAATLALSAAILLLFCCCSAAVLLLFCCYSAAILLLFWLYSSFILLCRALCGALFRALCQAANHHHQHSSNNQQQQQNPNDPKQRQRYQGTEEHGQTTGPQLEEEFEFEFNPGG